MIRIPIKGGTYYSIWANDQPTSSTESTQMVMVTPNGPPDWHVVYRKTILAPLRYLGTSFGMFLGSKYQTFWEVVGCLGLD